MIRPLLLRWHTWRLYRARLDDADWENYQNWSSFAWGYQQTGNNAFLDKAQVQSGGGDLPVLLDEQHQAGDPLRGYKAFRARPTKQKARHQDPGQQQG